MVLVVYLHNMLSSFSEGAFAMRQPSLYLHIVFPDCFLAETKPLRFIDHILCEPNRPVCRTVNHSSIILLNFSLRNTTLLFVDHSQNPSSLFSYYYKIRLYEMCDNYKKLDHCKTCSGWRQTSSSLILKTEMLSAGPSLNLMGDSSSWIGSRCGFEMMTS